MKELFKPDIEEFLRPLLAQGTNDGQKTPEEWLSGYALALAANLRKDPRQYRSYGPYWWIVKRALISHGIEDFGFFLDNEWIEKTAYANEVWDMLAGHVYSEYAVQSGLVYSHTHFIAYTLDDGEVEEDQYVLFDDDMEVLIG